MPTTKYTYPVIFRKLKNGTKFALLLRNIVYVKVPPQNVIESGGRLRKVNAISKSGVFKTWVMDVEMAYIKEKTL